MAGELAKKMVERRRKASRPKEKANITLDGDTLRLAEKWSVGTLKETIAMFAVVADEAMSEVDLEDDNEASGMRSGLEDEEKAAGGHE